MLIPVLLAGGTGTRLWPASRESRPKQFLSLVGDSDTLLSQTLVRLRELDDIENPIAIGAEAHRFVIAEQMRAAGFDGRIILEPAARDTAAAVAAAAFDAIAKHGTEAELLVLPKDHAVGNSTAFAETIRTARLKTKEGFLALFGVRPTRPETGYGYIRVGESLGPNFYDVESFVEKPDASFAIKFFEAGNYYWNSGIFLFKAEKYLSLLCSHAIDIYDSVKLSYERAERDFDFLRLNKAAFEKAPSDSIDYAVMEKTDRAVVATLDAEWSDLGSWSAVAEANGLDKTGNATVGDVWLEDTKNCFVRAESRLVAALGAHDQIIVETSDAVLVADRSREQDVKVLVKKLENAGYSQAKTHRPAYRPWGNYEQIAAGPRFQVKRIRVSPGGKLSLQSHHHRAEHWIVVRGTARVTRGDNVQLLTENQSTYISLGELHRLENPGKVELELIEVQSGSYLGEDDIVRYDDVYGRPETEEHVRGAAKGTGE